MRTLMQMTDVPTYWPFACSAYDAISARGPGITKTVIKIRITNQEYGLGQCLYSVLYSLLCSLRMSFSCILS